MKLPKKIEEEIVRKSIIDSFAMSRYPGDSRLVKLNPGDDWDSKEIFERLQNKSWEDILFHLEKINGPELYWYSSIYTMLTPESFYYYLPAFLVIAMDLPRADVVGTDLIYYLSLPCLQGTLTEVRLKQYIDDIIIQLSLLQRVAIQNWVRYLLQYYPEWTQVKDLHCWL